MKRATTNSAKSPKRKRNTVESTSAQAVTRDAITEQRSSKVNKEANVGKSSRLRNKITGKIIGKASTSAKNNNAIPERISNPIALPDVPIESIAKTRAKAKKQAEATAALVGAEMSNLSKFDQIPTQSEVIDEFENDGIQVFVKPSEDDFGDSEEDSEPNLDSVLSVNAVTGTIDSATVNSVGVNSAEAAQGTNVQSSLQFQDGVSATPQGAAEANKEGPLFNHMIDELVEERVRRKLAEERCLMLEKEREELANKQAHQEQGEEDEPPRPTVQTPKRRNGNLFPVQKSPSDTTIYAPALAKTNVNNLPKNAIEQISNFVEEIRAASEPRQSRDNTPVRFTKKPTPQGHQGSNKSDNDDELQELQEKEENKQATEKLLVEAEQFKATIAAPQGNNVSGIEKLLIDKFKSELEIRRFLDDDDDFFHVSCHLEPSMKNKIERGEYVDLERLLPKDKFKNRLQDTEGFSLPEIFTRGGHTYVGTPPDKEQKINSIRKWEQAFRVYAAVYTEAHPDRSSEIWQYINNINVAAASYQWENVAYYDYVFRQLMSEKPWRSWGKTYAQGWNLALRSVINSGGKPHQSFAGEHNSYSQGASSSNSSSSNSWKDDCCWKFNKNNCEKTNLECRYHHRCTFCAGWGHGKFNCRKRNNGGGRGRGGPNAASRNNTSRPGASTTQSHATATASSSNASDASSTK